MLHQCSNGVFFVKLNLSGIKLDVSDIIIFRSSLNTEQGDMK